MNDNYLKEHASQFNEAVTALIELEAMKAENQRRAMEGMEQAYGEQEFTKLLEMHDLGYNSCISKSLRFQ